MIKIVYLNNIQNESTLFELHFCVYDYIGKEYFKKYGEKAETYFYIDLLIKHGLCSGNANDFYETPTFDSVFRCYYQNIPFKMHRDDWNTIYFSVDKKNLHYRKEIAEHIRMLIEQKNQ